MEEEATPIHVRPAARQAIRVDAADPILMPFGVFHGVFFDASPIAFDASGVCATGKAAGDGSGGFIARLP